MRAIAALMVVANHMFEESIGGIFKYIGGLGVDIFFVLSGFLMVHTQSERRGAQKFFLDRIKRIYPTYIITSLPLIIIICIIKQQDVTLFLGNIFLLPGLNFDNYKMVNPPAWTLVYEMIFYIFFSLALILSRKKAVTATITCTIIIAILLGSAALGTSPERKGWVNLEYILNDTLMLNFAFGCLYAIAFDHIKTKLTISFKAFFIIVLALIFTALIPLHGSIRLVCFGIPSLIIVMVATLSKPSSGSSYKFIHGIGDSSYSLYLSHIYFVFIAIAINKSLHPSNNTMLALSLLFFLASIYCGLRINKHIEKPIIRYFKRSKPFGPAQPSKYRGSDITDKY